MKTQKIRFAFCNSMKRAGGLFTLAAGFLLVGNIAQAHLTYGGAARDFGIFSGTTNGSKTITNQAVTSNYGWADAADGVLGDSHRSRAFRFTLQNSALVTLTVAAYGGATVTSTNDLTPAFSIYAGLVALAPYAPGWTNLPVSADHDFGPASQVWRAWWEQQYLGGDGTTNNLVTDGCWNAVGDWSMAGDGDLPGDFAQLSSFIYKGSAASTTSGGSVTGQFGLPAGNYTILIGGNDIANKTSGSAALARGIAATLSVTSAPPLSIEKKVFVAWPSGTATNWFLQSSTTVNGPTWNGVTNTPVTIDGVPGVVLPVSESLKFFRFNYAP